jgi:hypothetical protein
MSSRRRLPAGPLLMTAGALLAATALFLPWEVLDPELMFEDRNVRGYANPLLAVPLVLFAVPSLVLGLVALWKRTRGVVLGAGVTAIVLGLLLAGASLIWIPLITSYDVSRPGIGIYVSAVAGAVVSAAGVASILGARRLPSPRYPPAAPSA